VPHVRLILLQLGFFFPACDISGKVPWQSSSDGYCMPMLKQSLHELPTLAILSAKSLSSISCGSDSLRIAQWFFD
jgi:hypothetical protein